jgi:hypothetical protein
MKKRQDIFLENSLRLRVVLSGVAQFAELFELLVDGERSVNLPTRLETEWPCLLSLYSHVISLIHFCL